MKELVRGVGAKDAETDMDCDGDTERHADELGESVVQSVGSVAVGVDDASGDAEP